MRSGILGGTSQECSFGLQAGAADITAASRRSGSGRRREHDDCFGTRPATPATAATAARLSGRCGTLAVAGGLIGSGASRDPDGSKHMSSVGAGAVLVVVVQGSSPADRRSPESLTNPPLPLSSRRGPRGWLPLSREGSRHRRCRRDSRFAANGVISRARLALLLSARSSHAYPRGVAAARGNEHLRALAR